MIVDGKVGELGFLDSPSTSARGTDILGADKGAGGCTCRVLLKRDCFLGATGAASGAGASSVCGCLSTTESLIGLTVGLFVESSRDVSALERAELEGSEGAISSSDANATFFLPVLGFAVVSSFANVDFRLLFVD